MVRAGDVPARRRGPGVARINGLGRVAARPQPALPARRARRPHAVAHIQRLVGDWVSWYRPLGRGGTRGARAVARVLGRARASARVHGRLVQPRTRGRVRAPPTQQRAEEEGRHTKQVEIGEAAQTKHRTCTIKKPLGQVGIRPYGKGHSTVLPPGFTPGESSAPPRSELNFRPVQWRPATSWRRCRCPCSPLTRTCARTSTARANRRRRPRLRRRPPLLSLRIGGGRSEAWYPTRPRRHQRRHGASRSARAALPTGC